ncbi:MAG: serine/threonine protein kinase [Acidobacteria bacterium]|nr:serine/threonine protein kinase [Acidobacteriota bacterium]
MFTHSLAIDTRKPQYLPTPQTQEKVMALEELIGQVLDEKYRLEEKLGQGGMGAVYLATHLGTERPVALKIIAPQFMRHPEFVERFKREAKAAGRLRHPNVVNVTDFGFAQIEKERIAYLVMEYLDGCTLSEVLSEEGRLPLKFTVDILEQVCAAIDTAHQQGIIHRDLKPDNIWLEPDGCGSYNVKVLDFGLAKLGEVPNRPSGEAAILEPEEPCVIQKFFNKNGCNTNENTHQEPVVSSTPILAISSSNTAITTLKASTEFSSAQSLEFTESPTEIQSSLDDEAKTQIQIARKTANPIEKSALVTHIGAVLGTPIYMSPEQCRGESLDTRSDIYSLGIIAYQMLVGQTPFSGDTKTLITHHIQTSPEHLRNLRGDIPKSVASLIMSTLAKNPAERPATAVAFSNALRARSEGASTVLRQAVSLYNNNFPTFLQISAIGYMPVIFFSLLMRLHTDFVSSMITDKASFIIYLLIGTFLIISCLFTEAVVHAAFVPAVAQVLITPFKSLSVSQIFSELKKKIVPILTTNLVFEIYICLWSMLLILPGLKALVSYVLFKPVIMMEGLKNRAALLRSRALVNRLPMVTLKVIAVKFLIASLMFINFASVSKNLSDGEININLKFLSPPILSLLGVILITPILSISIALLYFKLRQAGGETLKEALGQFGEDSPRSKWQLKMRSNSRFYNKMLNSR